MISYSTCTVKGWDVTPSSVNVCPPKNIQNRYKKIDIALNTCSGPLNMPEWDYFVLLYLFMKYFLRKIPYFMT